jgi:hypothetical protein
LARALGGRLGELIGDPTTDPGGEPTTDPAGVFPGVRFFLPAPGRAPPWLNFLLGRPRVSTEDTEATDEATEATEEARGRSEDPPVFLLAALPPPPVFLTRAFPAPVFFAVGSAVELLALPELLLELAEETALLEAPLEPPLPLPFAAETVAAAAGESRLPVLELVAFAAVFTALALDAELELVALDELVGSCWLSSCCPGRSCWSIGTTGFPSGPSEPSSSPHSSWKSVSRATSSGWGGG